MSKTFLFCIPVRFGVFVLSLVTVVSAGFAAGATWWVFEQTSEHPENFQDVHVTKGYKIALGVAGGFFTVVAVIALLGLLGSLFRKRSFIALFSALLWFSLLLDIAAIVLGIIGLIRIKDSDKSELIADCQRGAKTQQQVDGCTRVFNVVHSTGFLVFCAIWLGLQVLMQLYYAIIARRYLQQLDTERTAERTYAKA